MKKYLLMIAILLMSLLSSEVSNANVKLTVKDVYNAEFEFESTEDGGVTIYPKEVYLGQLKLVDKYFMPDMDTCLYTKTINKYKKKEKRNKIILVSATITAFVLGILVGK